MKATLIKEKEGVYSLLDGNRFISTTECKEGTPNKLSKENCDEIFGVVDVKDIRKSVNTGVYLGSTTSNTLMSIATEQSLQQPKEIEVEIEMVCPQCKDWGYVDECRNNCNKKFLQQKLDDNNCLILKKIK